MFAKRCTKCLLPENYPDVGLNAGPVCRYCLGERHFGVEADPQLQALMHRKEQLRQNFEKTVEACRGQGRYDCMVPLSGGKDSAYLAYLLKQHYGLKILTFTVDTGLLSPLAVPNAARVASRLNVDHIIATPKPEFFKRLYRYLLTHPSFERKRYEEVGYLSTVCQVCCAVIHSLCMQAAADKDIPFVALAYSPDQIEHHFYEVPREEIYDRDWAPEALRHPPFDREDLTYFWDPRAFSDRPQLPRLLLPLHVLEYPGTEAVTRKVVELGLLEKRKASLFVTNCHLNWFMMYLDARRLGYNPSVAALSHQVRQGHTRRLRWLLLLELERIAIKLGLYGKVWKRNEMTEALRYLDLKLSDLLR